MSGHTPGPWRVVPRYPDKVVDTEGSTIAEVFSGHLHGCEFEPNARLIAAAPELLDLLKEVLKDTDGMVLAHSLTKAYAFVKKLEAP